MYTFDALVYKQNALIHNLLLVTHRNNFYILRYNILATNANTVAYGD